MAPSGHSSSSHSSSSHSSGSHSSGSRSSSSSSRSSSSRSSYSSSRSSSSRSSYSGSSRSSGSGRYSGGPSRHSGSSHSGSSSRFTQPSRTRYNQPTGYKPTGNTTQRPHYVYGRRHDYIYYPFAWTDDSTGVYYEKGYYDENGTRYDDVAFNKNGQYENVLCHCPYCGQDTVMNLNAKDVESRDLKCPSCGGPLEIRSQLDDYMQTDADIRSNPQYQGEQPSEMWQNTPPVRNRHGCLLWFVVIFIATIILYFIGNNLSDKDNPSAGYSYTSQQTYTDPEEQDVLYLVQTSGNGYRFSDSEGNADKKLAWDEDAESFYDPDSECWIWQNTDVEPPVWQYWYEGISSDYGDYGWMEHDADGWFIEASYDNWIELPAEYDTSDLWYIDEIDYNQFDTLYLVRSGKNAYKISEDGFATDKTLTWDSSYESFYDPDSDCWVWYNTDVEPPVWQYWYEGISSDYGDYGWMEHDADGWFIEASYGDWIELPAEYDASGLWYFE